MHIVHGTWVPAEPGQFVQGGQFYLWVEVDSAVAKASAGGIHPATLTGHALETFLAEKVGLHSPYGRAAARSFPTRTFLLPSADGRPLPSMELLPYTEVDVPEGWALAAWQICCYPLSRPIDNLNDIHFTALHAAEDFQLGSDFLFWHQFSQVLKEIVAGDHYIPSLSYHLLKGAGKRQKPAFELYPGWEILSPVYEAAIERYAACIPAVCTAAVHSPEARELWEPDTLLRHFAECSVNSIVSDTPITTKLDQQIAGTPLHECVHVDGPVAGSEDTLEIYRQWAGWRHKLLASQTGADFTLCFRLEEAADEVDDWRIQFVVASRRDPSLKLSLAEYWDLAPTERAGFPMLGTNFERNLLLALGYAARIYPKVWEGMDTARPTGFRLNLEEAFTFLTEDAWVLEDAGYTLIVPAWCTPEGRRRAKIRARASVASSSSSAAKGYFSLDSLVEYRYRLAIGDDVVTEAEWEQLLTAKTPLVQFRGQWMELDRERMKEMLRFWREQQQMQPEMTLLDLMKASAADDGDLEWEYDLSLQDVLASLQQKSAPEVLDDLPHFSGTLREYQKQGVAWLRYLERLGLNPCLADDMGLGKTVQVIAQLVAERNEQDHVEPTLLIAPTSVLGNWRREIERFAPHLRALVHQGSARIRDEADFKAACDEVDIVITSFALARLDEKLLRRRQWRRVVVDEAQNIKNPKAAQTRAIIKLPAEHRLALTGTPVENRLLDLWSIFNFLNPGYLGKEAQFRRSFEIPIQRDNNLGSSAALKKLIEPFILRRLKTDRKIIADLPDKVEQKVYCNLTPEQASLYELVVQEATGELGNVEGMERRGLILATLMKLKQICNHPAHFLQDGSAFTGERSHKLQRLSEMVEEVLDNDESVLIFTQFTEIGTALERHIKRTHGCATYFLHGGTSARKRDELVATFQDPESPPAVFILSLRAGGTGLTLTKANHVFHFDRWWNPAVEDQATDRAFRIGQRKNVFAHKFVTAGTVEERIDQMIEDKKGLARSIVGSDESWLTELDDESFKDLIALRRTAIVE